MDRNSAIGLTLISAILLAYFYFFAPEPTPQSETITPTVQTQDTSATASSSQAQQATQVPDSVLAQKYGPFSSVLVGQAETAVLENKDIKVFFSTKGANVEKIILKNYKTYAQKELVLIDQQNSTISQQLPTTFGTIGLHEIYYTASPVQTKGDSSMITFTSALPGGGLIIKTYALAKEGFVLKNQLGTSQLEKYLANQPLQIVWKDKINHTEKDVEQSRLTSAINFYDAEGNFESFNDNSKDPDQRTVEQKIKWISFKSKFFSSALISNQAPLSQLQLVSEIDTKDTLHVKNLSASFSLPLAAINNQKADFSWYFGPNKYEITQKVTDGFNENVYLGWPVINLVNKYLILPIFNVLESFLSNYGLIIIMVVIIIRIILFPLSFRSYVSMAKIKVLKPELDEIKAKHGEDMAAIQQDQMKLYQQVGVNPLAGCIPLLLQMPILLAMFNFFPNAIELRQQSFLWADDLSTYDVIAQLPFTIPFYGNHVSLFTILMTISTLMYTYLNNQVATMQQGPMVAMSYIMPVVFMFILNSLPAGLSFYYFVSNVASISQQYIIKAFVDEKQIRAKLEENKKNAPNRKVTGFQKRLQDAMKAQEEMKKQSSTKKK